MQSLSFDDIDFEAEGAVATPTPTELSFDDIDFESVPVVEATELGDPYGPERESHKDRISQAKDMVKAEGGSYQEQMEAAQKASTEFKIEQNGIQGIGFSGGDQRAKDFTTGVKSTLLGFGQLGFDAADLIGFDVSELSEKNKAAITELNSRIKDKDFFSSGNLGKIAPTLATLPVAYASKMVAFTVEGLIGYSEARGSGAGVVGSLLGGLIAGGGTAAVMKGFELLGARGSTVLDELTKEFNLAPEQLDEIYTNFAKATGKEANKLTNYDKAVSILAQGDKKGAEYMTLAAKADVDAKAALDDLSKSRGQAVESEIGGNKVDSAIKPIQEQKAFAEGRYNEVKAIATEMGPEKVQAPLDKFLENVTDDFIATLPKKVKTILEKGGTETTMVDLFEIREALNGQVVKIRKANKKEMQTIDAQEFIDTIITNNMPENFKPLWEASAKELAISYAMRGGNKRADANNIFGSLLTDAGKPIDQRTMTYADMLDKIAKSSGGGKEMNEFLQAIGSDNMAKFEKGLVGEIYQSGDVALDKVIKQLEHVEMTTPDGMRLKSNLKALDKAFSSDDFYQMAEAAWKTNTQDGSAITANLLSKVKYTVAGQLWTKIFRKWVPFTQEGKQLRHLDRVIKAIKESKPVVTDIKGLTPEQISEFTPVFRESIQKAIDDEIGVVKKNINVQTMEEGMQGQPKQIGTQEGPTYANIDMNGKPMPVSPEGQVIDDIMEYDSKKLVSNFIDESMVTNQLKARMGIPINSSFEEVTDRIAGRIDNYLPTEKRIQNIMGNYNNEITAAVNTMDRAKSYKVARNIVEQEANTLIKNIEKDIGVKLPKNEADKIVMMRIKEMIDACK